MSLLTARGLTKRFGGVTAVDDVSFQLVPGEFLALIGPNGAGKSTCFNIINGFVKPDTGRVVFSGADVTGLAPRKLWRRGAGRTFQIAETFRSMTVIENVAVVLVSHHNRTLGFAANRVPYRDEANKVLARVGLADLGDRSAATLAYGDAKRLELAIAIAHGPRLLLMDEPTAGMAREERRSIMALVASLVADDGISVLFTEHDMDTVFSYAHRIIVLNRGQLIADGPPEAIRADRLVRDVYLGGGAQSAAVERA